MILAKTKNLFNIKNKNNFERLRPFIGKKLYIRLKNDVYYVCTKYSRRVLISSDKSMENAIHLRYKDCDFRFRNHIGHNLRCVCYGNGSIQNISVECEDCNTVLYDVDVKNN